MAVRYFIPLFVLLLLGCFHLPARGQTLNASVTLDHVGNIWQYTLQNTEPVGSDNWLTDFYLPIGSPVSNVNAPTNWIIDTDSATFVHWSNIEAFPYPHDVAPGLMLSGFSFESNAPEQTVSSVISSWDHNLDNIGPDVTLTARSPSAVPEPNGTCLLSIMLCGTMLVLRVWRQKHSLKRLVSLQGFCGEECKKKPVAPADGGNHTDYGM